MWLAVALEFQPSFHPDFAAIARKYKFTHPDGPEFDPVDSVMVWWLRASMRIFDEEANACHDHPAKLTLAQALDIWGLPPESHPNTPALFPQLTEAVLRIMRSGQPEELRLQLVEYMHKHCMEKMFPLDILRQLIVGRFATVPPYTEENQVVAIDGTQQRLVEFQRHTLWYVWGIHPDSEYVFPALMTWNVVITLVPVILQSPEQEELAISVPSTEQQLQKRSEAVRELSVRVGSFCVGDILHAQRASFEGKVEWRPKSLFTLLLSDVCILDLPTMDLHTVLKPFDLAVGASPTFKQELEAAAEAVWRDVSLAHLYAEHAHLRHHKLVSGTMLRMPAVALSVL